MKKTLLKILLGASLFFGDKNLNAQNVDSLKEIDIRKFDEPLTDFYGIVHYKRIAVFGWHKSNPSPVVNFSCYDTNNDGNYNLIHIAKLEKEERFNTSLKERKEKFNIHFDSGLIDYKIELGYEKIAEFKNLTKEQIYQDKEFGERTKRIINACESDEKLREMVKEIYKEGGEIKIPQIKQ